jgi:UDP-glucose 4-epimerase
VVIRALEGLPRCRVIAASSADVYCVADHPHTETEAPAPPDTYGLSKQLMEAIVEYGCRTNHNLSGVVLRFFNIYGPRETNPHFIPRALELIHMRELREIRMGYLSGTRDFVHVFDVVEAILASMFYSGARFSIFNVGTGTPISIRTVLQMLMDSAGDDRPVVEDRERFRSFDRKSLTASVEKITSTIGWRPSICLPVGLASLVSEKILINPISRPQISIHL